MCVTRRNLGWFRSGNRRLGDSDVFPTRELEPTQITLEPNLPVFVVGIGIISTVSTMARIHVVSFVVSIQGTQILVVFYAILEGVPLVCKCFTGNLLVRGFA